jgi:hypothetical protein
MTSETGVGLESFERLQAFIRAVHHRGGNSAVQRDHGMVGHRYFRQEFFSGVAPIVGVRYTLISTASI